MITPTLAPVRLTVTVAAMRRHNAYELDARIAELATHLGRVPAADEPMSLIGVWASLLSTSADDIVWALRAAEPTADAHRVAVIIATRAARRVEHLLPAKGLASRLAAIEAAEAWISEPTPERVAAAADAWASYATDAAADADTDAGAAYAAARAAAADDAADAADAAESAAWAVWAAWAADADTDTIRADLAALLA